MWQTIWYHITCYYTSSITYDMTYMICKIYMIYIIYYIYHILYMTWYDMIYMGLINTIYYSHICNIQNIRVLTPHILSIIYFNTYFPYNIHIYIYTHVLPSFSQVFGGKIIFSQRHLAVPHRLGSTSQRR